MRNTRTLALLSLALLLSGPVHAYIDYGATNGVRGVTDTVSGLTWVVTGSLEEGAAAGFRAASTDEFRQFLADSNWVKATGAGEQYSLNTGTTTSDGKGGQLINAPAITFDLLQHLHGYGQNINPNLMTPYLYGDPAFLDGGATGQAGFLVSEQIYGSYTSGGRLGGTVNTTTFVNAALIGNIDQAKQGVYNTSLIHWSDLVMNTGALKSNASQDDPSAWMYHPWPTRYFMVASVPEPGTSALMGLGLAIGGLTLRRRR